VLSGQESLITKTKPESHIIINKLCIHGRARPSELFGAKNMSKMDAVITAMIGENIIQYDIHGDVKWRGKIQEKELARIKDVNDKGDKNDN